VPWRSSRLSTGLRYGPFLAHIVIIRRCNLSCGYATNTTTARRVPYKAGAEVAEAARAADLDALHDGWGSRPCTPISFAWFVSPPIWLPPAARVITTVIG